MKSRYQREKIHFMARTTDEFKQSLSVIKSSFNRGKKIVEENLSEFEDQIS